MLSLSRIIYLLNHDVSAIFRKHFESNPDMVQARDRMASVHVSTNESMDICTREALKAVLEVRVFCNCAARALF